MVKASSSRTERFAVLALEALRISTLVRSDGQMGDTHGLQRHRIGILWVFLEDRFKFLQTDVHPLQIVAERPGKYVFAGPGVNTQAVGSLGQRPRPASNSSRIAVNRVRIKALPLRMYASRIRRRVKTQEIMENDMRTRGDQSGCYTTRRPSSTRAVPPAVTVAFRDEVPVDTATTVGAAHLEVVSEAQTDDTGAVSVVADVGLVRVDLEDPIAAKAKLPEPFRRSAGLAQGALHRRGVVSWMSTT